MRVCSLTTSFPQSEEDDSSIFVKRLIDAFANLGMTGVVITPERGELTGNEIDSGFEVTRVKYGLFSTGSLVSNEGIMPTLRKRPWLIYEAALLILALALHAFKRRREFDVIHANWIGAGCAALISSALIRKPYVLTIRGEDMNLINHRVFGIILRPALLGAAAITSVNQAFIEELQLSSPRIARKLYFIPNGATYAPSSEAQQRELREKLQLPQDSNVATFIGTVVPRKRIELLFEGLTGSEDRLLIICGRFLENAPYIKELHASAERLGIMRQVRFIGALPPNEISTLLDISSVYLSASKHEGRPNSVLEAMASGTPVILSNIPAHRELIGDSERGQLFNTGEELRAALSFVSNNPQEVERKSSKALEFMASLSWSRSATQYEELFHEAIS